MNATETIREALKQIMSAGEANACEIRHGWAYDGSQQRYGWHFTRFGSTPTYLGKSLADALAMAAQIAESRESE